MILHFFVPQLNWDKEINCLYIGTSPCNPCIIVNYSNKVDLVFIFLFFLNYIPHLNNFRSRNMYNFYSTLLTYLSSWYQILAFLQNGRGKSCSKIISSETDCTSYIKLVSKELLHFGVIARLFRQIGGHSGRFVLCSSIWRLFIIKMIRSVKVFPFSFWKIISFFTS